MKGTVSLIYSPTTWNITAVDGASQQVFVTSAAPNPIADAGGIEGTNEDEEEEFFDTNEDAELGEAPQPAAAEL